MTTGRVLARNSAFSLAGQVVPLAVALLVLPPLMRGLGADRFAILALAWAAIGYLGVFELGLSRALTQAIARRLADRSTDDLGQLAWSALGAMLLFGVVAGLLFAAATPLLVLRVLNVPPELHAETMTTFFVLAASLPVVIGGIGLRAIMEAHQDFGAATALRIPIGTLMFVGPLIALGFSRSLVWAVGAVVATRVIGFALHLAYCVRTYAYMRRLAPFTGAVVRPLIWYGAWSTVSNIVSPLMVVLDRFIIGALLPLAAVAHYVTPYEAITRLLVIPVAMLSAMFPAFSAVAGRDPVRMEVLYGRALRLVTIAMFPLALVAVVLAHEALALWMGNGLPAESVAVLQWLAVGVFVNAIAQPPFTALQGAGRPDLIAKLHVVELPFYLAILVLLTRAHGLTGVAMAWTLRVGVDAMALLVLARRSLSLRFMSGRASRIGLAMAVTSFVVGAMLDGTSTRLIFTGLSLALYAPLAWRWMLAPGERAAITHWLRPSRAAAVPHPDTFP